MSYLVSTLVRMLWSRTNPSGSDKESDILQSVDLLYEQSSQQLQVVSDKLNEIMEKAGMAANAATECRSLAAKLLFHAQNNERIMTERNVLAALHFDSMRARESDIPAPHSETLEWIFRKDQGCSLFHWLSSGDGMFWIAGRAGSGKSTLMRFLNHHQRTKEALQLWSAPNDFVLASHFFCASGRDQMQYSLQGLLQHLLLQVLEQVPRLIPSACASRLRPMDHLGSRDPWTLDELTEALRLVTSSEVSQTHFCFLIDGLDEQHQDVGNTINVLKAITSRPSVKVCVSSRPWHIFETDLGQDSSRRLDLHDLTKNDIRRYVEERLVIAGKVPRVGEHYTTYQGLVNQIVDRAQGVFLWVQLVVSSLLRGIADGDNVDEICRRLETTPDDLDDYLERIFHRIESTNRSESAHILLVLCEATTTTLPLYTVTALQHDWCDIKLALQANFKAVEEAEIDEDKDRMAARLDARCSDFVALSRTELPSWDIRSDRRFEVKLLHKAVLDFLTTGKGRRTLDQWAPKFNPHIALCNRLLLHIKSLPPIVPRHPDHACLQSYLWATREFCRCQRVMEQSTEAAHVALIEEFGRTLAHLVFFKAPQDSSWAAFNLLTYGKQDGLLAFAITQRITLYVEAKLAKRTWKTRTSLERPLLDYALRGSRRLPEYWRDAWMTDDELKETHHKDAEMVAILLRAGSNPNERVSGDTNATVWSRFLEQLLHVGPLPVGKELHDTSYKQAKLMLEYGADPSLKIIDFRPWPESERIDVLKIFENSFKNEEQLTELQGLVERSHRPKRALRSMRS